MENPVPKSCAVQYDAGAERIDTSLIEGKSATTTTTTAATTSTSDTGTKSSSKLKMAKEIRIWMVLAALFIAISIALSIYLIYVKKTERTDVHVEEKPPGETEVLSMYPAFFRTARQQEEFAAQYERMIQPWKIRKAPLDSRKPTQTCSFRCFNQTVQTGYPSLVKRDTGGRKYHRAVRATTHKLFKRQTTQSPDIHHACCISTPNYIDPTNALAIWGSNVTVIQYGAWRQYFPIEDC
ncbi:hypothetical protein EGW08_010423, partial [Elysia chlorotica]